MQGHRHLGLGSPVGFAQSSQTKGEGLAAHNGLRWLNSKEYKSLPDSIPRHIVLRPSASSLSCRGLQKVP